jgi:hypothetical protein
MDAKAFYRRSGSRLAVWCRVLVLALPLWLGLATNPASASPAAGGSGAAGPAPASAASGAGGASPAAATRPAVNAAPAGGEGSAAAPVPAALAAAAAAGPCAPAAARVESAYREVRESIAAPAAPAAAGAAVQSVRSDEVSLGDVLTVEVADLPHLLEQLAAPNCKGKQLVLYLDDRPLADLVAFPPTDPAGSTLRFTLKRTEKSREPWAFLLGTPGWQPRETKVSIGLADGYAFPSDAAPVKLAVIPRARFTFWALLLGLMLIAFLVLAARSDLLRDADPPPPGGTARRAFSLARSQAAWWFFLILASYLFIGLITGDFSTSITGTVLVLLGISAGTVVGSAAVDASKSTPVDQANRALTTEVLTAQVEQVKTRLALLQPTDAPQAVAAALQAAQSQLKVAQNETENFMVDILSDANGVSFPRFQIAAWTVVLGIIFVSEVYRNLAMPTFDGSLLSLMGISSGTYLGMKIPEPKLPTVA